ncbi:hypothetical protein AB3Y40_15230 [Yoonia sp. R2331]|uniref:hypothetical protein n=1 Tax=Yoonia sp. R2331 TaxID=3237238 RepID=UPI0034E40F8E
MDIYFGIDGTGPDDNDTYKTDFQSSHVRQLFEQWHTPLAGYLRGPRWHGTGTPAKSKQGLDWVVEQWEKQQKLATVRSALSAKPTRIFLSGYSRGGAAVIELAYNLNKKGIPVHCMMLFDAVDRSPLENCDTISKNVAMVYHALRDPKAGSRESFGNCGLKHPSKGLPVFRKFFCTHGGVGGCPWDKAGKSGKIEEMSTKAKIGAVAAMGKHLADIHDFTNVTVAQDKAGALASWQWMQSNLRVARATGLDKSIGNVGDFNLRSDIMLG